MSEARFDTLGSMGVSKEQANLLLGHNMDVGVMRPYLETEGNSV